MTDTTPLRNRILAARDRLPAQDIAAASSAIGANLLDLDDIRSCSAICIYVSFRSEVQTLPIIRALLEMGKRVAVPLTRVREKRLDLVRIEDPETELVPGYCHIPEPRETLLPARLVDPHTLDQIVLPGSVFDERGGRFGYGGGYYDRLLASVPGAGRTALAFELQVVTALELAPHDQLLDRIVTERRVITGRRQR